MKRLFITMFVCGFFSSCFAGVGSLAISNDGKYTISADGNSHAYLYNLDKHTVKDLGGEYNFYSAYFIPNTDYYSLQNSKTNEVTIFDENQKVIKKFTPSFEAKAQAINEDMSLWVGSDNGGNVYQYNIQDKKEKQIFVSWLWGKMPTTPYWRGNPYKGKLPNGWTLSNQFTFYKDKLIMTAENLLVVYDTKNNKWKMVNKNVNETMNTISPDGKFVYTADSMGAGVKYNLNDQSTIEYGILQKHKDSAKDVGKNATNGITNFKFIDDGKAIATYKGAKQPYLWLSLYDINDFKRFEGAEKHPEWRQYYITPISSLPLVKNPMKFITGDYKDNTDPRPNTTGYNTIFDTSVEAHKLVMAGGDGIMVYNYNPKDESLKLDWIGEPPKAESKEEKKGWFW
jgi:hypothetical protein